MITFITIAFLSSSVIIALSRSLVSTPNFPKLMAFFFRSRTVSFLSQLSLIFLKSSSLVPFRKKYVSVYPSNQKIYKPTNKMKKFKTHGIRLKTINLCYKIWTPTLTSTRFNQKPHRCGTVVKLDLTPMESGTRSSALTCFSNWTNVEDANRRASTIMVQVCCIYLGLWSMLHAYHYCAPSKIAPLRYPLQCTTGMDSPLHTIRVYG